GAERSRRGRSSGRSSWSSGSSRGGDFPPDTVVAGDSGDFPPDRGGNFAPRCSVDLPPAAGAAAGARAADFPRLPPRAVVAKRRPWANVGMRGQSWVAGGPSQVV